MSVIHVKLSYFSKVTCPSSQVNTLTLIMDNNYTDPIHTGSALYSRKVQSALHITLTSIYCVC